MSEDRRSVVVTRVSREYLGILNLEGYWIDYIVLDGLFPDYHGNRYIKAQDELAVYVEFPKQMFRRHGTNNVRWQITKEVV